MASVIKLKRSSTASAVPANNSLQTGELAINLTDKKLYSANASGHTIQLSGDAYSIGTTANTDNGTILLSGTGNASNTSLTITGANGIGITSDGAGAITVTANTVDVDLATVANTTSANLVLSGGGESETVKIAGDDHIVVAAPNTDHVTVSLTNAVSVASVQTSGNTVVGGDADITGEVNAASAAITGAAVIGTTLAAGNTTVTGFVNASTSVSVGANVTMNNSTLAVGTTNGKVTVSNNLITIGNSTVNTSITQSAFHTDVAADLDSTLNVTGVITAGDDVDISGEVNAATAAIVGNASVGGNLTITGDLTVSGTTTEVSSTTVTIDDGILSLADNQADGTGAGTDAVDVGFYGVFGNTSAKTFHGIVRDQSANAYVVFNGISTEPTTTVSYDAANSTSTGDLGQLDAIIDGGTY